MVLSVHRLGHFLKNPSKLENHHRQNPEAADYEASLGEFRSGVSSFLNQILLNSEPESELWTLGRVQSCLEVLGLIRKAFVKTVAALDHPVCLWGPEITEEYLNYSFDLMGLLNCVSSCLSHLNQARLSLSYGLSQAENSPSSAVKHLRNIQPLDLRKDFEVAGMKQGGEESPNYPDNRERVIHQALLIMKRVSWWILGVVLSGLYSDLRPYMELRKPALVFGHESLLLSVDSTFSKEIVDKQQVAVKEVKEVNEAAARLAAAPAGDGDCAAKEMEKQLQSFEERLEGMRKQTDHLFTEVLAARSSLVDCLRCTSSGKVN